MEYELENGRTCNQNEEEADFWVFDSSIDYKGRVPRRSSTGVWKASLFIIAIEFSERLSTFGISSNLISYLTKVMHQDLKTAAKNVNYWSGVTTMMPLLGGFIADAYTGQFFMVLFSSFIFFMGLSLLTMSQWIPSLRPCSNMTMTSCRHHGKVHEVFLFFGLYCLSIGTGGHKPCLQSFGADQFDSDHPEERKKKMSYFNWWNFALCFGLFLGMTVIVYIEDYVSWGVAYLILTITMAIMIVIFCIGRPYYRYRMPHGSPLTPMLKVMVAAFRKRNLPLALNPSMLYEIPKSQNSGSSLLNHTNRLRFLDKAAIIEEEETSLSGQKHNSSPNPNPNPNPDTWRLVTVTKVEELKLLLNTIPIWLTSLTFGICLAQTNTFYIKQAASMNLNLSNNFKIPPASIFSIGAIGMLVCITIYDKILVPILRKINSNERGIDILTRIGIGMALSIVAMVVAALVERKRIKTTTMSMSAFWLTPQSLIMGFGDSFAIVGLQEYFYDQVPNSMRSMGIAFYLSVIGAGSFLSSFLITVVDHVTERFGKSWFAKDINKCRLDNFYWLLTGLSGLNLCVFVVIARRYSYKNVQRRIVVGVDEDHHKP